MEHQTGDGLQGLLVTFCLWAGSNLLGLFGLITLATAATTATLISATIVAIANAPKAWKALQEFLNKHK